MIMIIYSYVLTYNTFSRALWLSWSHHIPQRVQHHMMHITVMMSLIVLPLTVAGGYCLRHQQLVKEQDFILSCVVSVCPQILVVMD